MHEKGVSLISIVVTIVIIIILASIIGVSSQKILKRAEENNIKQEFRNVEELVGTIRAKVLAGTFDLLDDYDDYIAEEEEIDSYANVLSEAEIDEIKEINGNDDILPNGKYYIMNQAAFDEVFGNEINVKDTTRSYLINFEKGVVVLKLGNSLYKTGEIK